ncbi:hypothetical protein HDU76_009015, partial [Blyttiomyces sp. JEL0837]
MGIGGDNLVMNAANAAMNLMGGGSTSTTAATGPGASNTNTDDGGDDSQTGNKRKRTSKACDTCNRRKVKCDGAQPACSQCFSHDLTCTYSREAKKRGPKQGQARDADGRSGEPGEGMSMAPSSMPGTPNSAAVSTGSGVKSSRGRKPKNLAGASGGGGGDGGSSTVGTPTKIGGGGNLGAASSGLSSLVTAATGGTTTAGNDPSLLWGGSNSGGGFHSHQQQQHQHQHDQHGQHSPQGISHYEYGQTQPQMHYGGSAFGQPSHLASTQHQQQQQRQHQPFNNSNAGHDPLVAAGISFEEEDVWAIIDKDFDNMMGAGSLKNLDGSRISLSDIANPFGFTLDPSVRVGSTSGMGISIRNENGGSGMGTGLHGLSGLGNIGIGAVQQQQQQRRQQQPPQQQPSVEPVVGGATSGGGAGAAHLLLDAIFPDPTVADAESFGLRDVLGGGGGASQQQAQQLQHPNVKTSRLNVSVGAVGSTGGSAGGANSAGAAGLTPSNRPGSAMSAVTPTTPSPSMTTSILSNLVAFESLHRKH